MATTDLLGSTSPPPPGTDDRMAIEASGLAEFREVAALSEAP